MTILNGKIEFFTIFHPIDMKMTKNWSKINTFLEYKNRVKFDYQKGDSGSAGMLEIKCVIIEAPKSDTVIDQNDVKTWKSTKNDQKSTKHKNRKKWKSEKTRKVTKPENQKSQKMTKSKSEKVKKVTFSKTPQNGQNVR